MEKLKAINNELNGMQASENRLQALDREIKQQKSDRDQLKGMYIIIRLDGKHGEIEIYQQRTKWLRASI